MTKEKTISKLKSKSKQNKVRLVGAGPGDIDLITVKGLKAIKDAQVIVYDRLIAKGLLDYAKKSCELIYVGKGRSFRSIKQSAINEILISKHREGKRVVRLKGGDPFIFGRGGEEVTSLLQEGIPIEVIPGVTSLSGAAASTLTSLTDRRLSSGITILTGHSLKGEGLPEHNYKAIAKLNHTIAFYMTVTNMSDLTNKLIKEGMDKDTPCMVVMKATVRGEKMVKGKLRNIAKKAMTENIKAPALLVIGKVVT